MASTRSATTGIIEPKTQPQNVRAIGYYTHATVGSRRGQMVTAKPIDSTCDEDQV